MMYARLKPIAGAVINTTPRLSNYITVPYGLEHKATKWQASMDATHVVQNIHLQESDTPYLVTYQIEPLSNASNFTAAERDVRRYKRASEISTCEASTT